MSFTTVLSQTLSVVDVLWNLFPSPPIRSERWRVFSAHCRLRYYPPPPLLQAKNIITDWVTKVDLKEQCVLSDCPWICNGTP